MDEDYNFDEYDEEDYEYDDYDDYHAGDEEIWGYEGEY